MSHAAKLDTHAAALVAESSTRTLGTRHTIDVARDLALLLTVCLTVGLTVGLGMMLAVLALASGG